MPIVGWPLAGLVALWLAGRVVTIWAAGLPWGAVMAIDLSLPLALIAALGRETVAGRNGRNLPVAGLIALFAAGQALFHIDAQADGAVQGAGLRLGLAAAVMLIALIGGRIVPSVTRNWLAARQAPALPVPAGRADTRVLALAAGMANLWRLSRWQGWRTRPEPLIWVLHAGFALIGLGFLAIAAAAAGWISDAGARHLWLAGACLLIAFAAFTPNPLSFGGWRNERFDPARPGIPGLIPHPFLVALVLWAAGHLPANGDLAHALIFAGFAGFAALGMAMIDYRRRRALGLAAFARLTAGRPHLPAQWPLRLLGGLALWLALAAIHPWLLGPSVMPF